MVAGAYIAFFAISQGAVIWVYISEVFPNRVRAKGQSLGSSTHWIMNFLISLAFPYFASRFGGGYPFVFFAVMMALMFVVVLVFFPKPRASPWSRCSTSWGLSTDKAVDSG